MTCFAEAGGQHVPGMARAVEALGIRACLTRSTMDSGEGLPPKWAAETTESCLQVNPLLSFGFAIFESEIPPYYAFELSTSI